MRVALSLSILFALGTPAAAQVTPYDGEWGLTNVPGCVQNDISVCPVLLIGNGTLQGEESLCQMSGAEAVRGVDAIAYDVSCQGEGDTWAYRGIFLIDDMGQLTILSHAGPSTYLPTAPRDNPQAAPGK